MTAVACHKCSVRVVATAPADATHDDENAEPAWERVEARGARSHGERDAQRRGDRRAEPGAADLRRHERDSDERDDETARDRALAREREQGPQQHRDADDR